MGITATKGHILLSSGLQQSMYKTADGEWRSTIRDVLIGYWPLVTSPSSSSDSYQLYYRYGTGSGSGSASIGHVGIHYYSPLEMYYVATGNTLFYKWTSTNSGNTYSGTTIITKLSDGGYIAIDLGGKTTDYTILCYDRNISLKNGNRSSNNQDFLETLSFQNYAPEGYVSLCPLMNGSGTWSEKGLPTELSLVSGIDNASWDMNGIKVGNKTLFGYDGICIAADTVIDETTTDTTTGTTGTN